MLKLRDYTSPQEIIEKYMGHELLVFGCKDKDQAKSLKREFAGAIIDYGYGIYKEESDLLQVRGTTLRFVPYNGERIEEKGFMFLVNFKFLREGTYSCGDQTHTVSEYRHEETGMEFALVPGGSFMMGSPDNNPDAEGYEQPLHEVMVKPFLISRTVVTQGVWKKIMKSEPWKGEDNVKEGENYPAVYVSWNDAKKFCEKTGLCLPSEAQWEYACRAGTTTKYYWGDEMDGGYAWYDANSYDIGERYAHEVGQKKPNAFGLYDMSGNVYEWCEDFWHDNYNGAPADGSAWTENSAPNRVFRGGSFAFGAVLCRSARRRGIWFSPDHRAYYLGFRLSRPAH